jgi:thiol-disulfide isomerase/thioredoxin
MASRPPVDAARRRGVAALALSALSLPFAPPALALSRVRPWPAKQPAPPLGLDDLDGRKKTLADWRGQAVLLNFWASWSEPSVAEMAQLSRQADRHAGRHAVQRVNFKESAPTARRKLAALPFAFPNLLDRDGSAFKAWTQGVLPTSILVDPTGRPRTAVAGEMDWDGAEAAALLEPLLAR